jgi:hypothetical protein
MEARIAILCIDLHIIQSMPDKTWIALQQVPLTQDVST